MNKTRFLKIIYYNYFYFISYSGKMDMFVTILNLKHLKLHVITKTKNVK